MVPYILIPQFVFGGAVAPVFGESITEKLSYIMTSRWAYGLLARLNHVNESIVRVISGGAPPESNIVSYAMLLLLLAVPFILSGFYARRIR